jgi:hypothetical protein
MSLKPSVVAASISIRAGRSARAHTIPDPSDTSPDCTPCVIVGRCDNRLKAGAAKPSTADIAVAEARVVRNRRRVVALPAHERSDMKWPPPNHRGEWTRYLTVRKR